MKKRKRKKIGVLVASSKLTLLKRAHKRIESTILICPILFGRPELKTTDRLWN